MACAFIASYYKIVLEQNYYTVIIWLWNVCIRINDYDDDGIDIWIASKQILNSYNFE